MKFFSHIVLVYCLILFINVNGMNYNKKIEGNHKIVIFFIKIHITQFTDSNLDIKKRKKVGLKKRPSCNEPKSGKLERQASKKIEQADCPEKI